MGDWREIIDINLVATARSLWPRSIRWSSRALRSCCSRRQASYMGVPLRVTTMSTRSSTSPLAADLWDRLAPKLDVISDGGAAYSWSKRHVRRLALTAGNRVG